MEVVWRSSISNTEKTIQITFWSDSYTQHFSKQVKSCYLQFFKTVTILTCDNVMSPEFKWNFRVLVRPQQLDDLVLVGYSLHCWNSEVWMHLSFISFLLREPRCKLSLNPIHSVYLGWILIDFNIVNKFFVVGQMVIKFSPNFAYNYNVHSHFGLRIFCYFDLVIS